MSNPTSTRQWILQIKPTDLPVLSGPSSTFKLRNADLPPLAENKVLVEPIYFSNDPAQRRLIHEYVDPKRIYFPPATEGDCMIAQAIAQVVDSRNSDLPKGTIVTAMTGWTEYVVLDAEACTPIKELPGVAVTHFLGALGPTGLTAYFGLTEVSKAGPEDTVVVSGAAGATGSMVVQIAKKMLGCKRVIGMAGSDEKCRWVESLGADMCLNYKKADFEKELAKATDGGVEVYFDNVGGEILDMMLQRMAKNGRVAACGAISAYNKAAPDGLKNYFEIISMSLDIKGFVWFDFVSHGKGAAAIQELIEALQAGKITVSEQNETVVTTRFENVPETWMKLFDGGNTGKLITRLDEKPTASP
ncbi:hypothetical protein MMC22_000990 [Lobaria immixta]|nr:hypothetical protein [Lobaria immixta]